MPIYEYHCDICDKTFESLVLGNETPGCPFCNNENVKRIMSACGFVSKGSAGPGGETVTTSKSAGSSPCAGCTSTNCGSCSI